VLGIPRRGEKRHVYQEEKEFDGLLEAKAFLEAFKGIMEKI